MLRPRNRCCLTIGALLLLNAVVAAAERPGKKVIEWGWDEPDTKIMRQNIAKMEEAPFDGVIYHVLTSTGEMFMWEMWGNRRFELAQFQHAIDDLKATKFQRWKDCFLRTTVMPATADWFDDKVWEGIAHNFEVAAQVAKQGGSKGFMFDTEQYVSLVFDYRVQSKQNKKTFEEFRAKARQRGREWIRAINRAYPDIVILMTFGYRTAVPKDGSPRSASEYGLLADFLDGALEACSPQTRLVDAWEFSYGYKTQKQYADAYRTIREESLAWTEVPDKYRQFMQAGFGVWMDNQWRNTGWNATDFSKNYFSPAEFQDSVRFALERTDEYVWIYTEKPKWWTPENLPYAYVEALKKAREQAVAKRSSDAKTPSQN